MEPLSVTASIIAVLQLTGEVISYLRDVKDAPKELDKCTIEALNLQHLLKNLRDRLNDATSTDPWYKALQKLNEKSGPLDQYKQALEQLRSKTTAEDRLDKLKRKLKWKFNKEEVADILRNIERLKSLVVIALEMDHFELTKAIQDSMIAVHNILPSIQTDLAAVRDVQGTQRDAQKLQQHQAMMQWLSPIDFTAQQQDIISRKEEGTGQWFLESTEFKAWQQGSDRTLFCPGIPGAGKTMIAAIAIDHLCKRAQCEDIGVAYLFCNYKAQAEQTYSTLIATALKQLVYDRPDIAGSVIQMYESHQKKNTRPMFDEIFKALQSACSALPTVYLVIDALDECTERDSTRTRLIKKFRELQAKIAVHLMFTARFIPEIEAQFQSDLILEVRASEHDVRRYVAGQITHLPKCIQYNSELSQDVQNKIAEAVNGMFLLARLYVDSLLDKKTTKKVKTALQMLEKGADQLDLAYSEAIKRIEEQLAGNAELAKQTLSWITYAERPLTTQELCHALAIELDESELDPDAVYDIDDILDVCAGLVIVDSESDAVRLVHYTTQEYLLRIRQEWLPNAQKDITSACLTYLSMDVFRSGACDSDEVFEARLQDHAFLDYAAKHWLTHAQTVQEAVCDLALAFLRNDSLVFTATQVIFMNKNKYTFHNQQYPKQSKGLHLVSKYGLTSFVKLLLGDSEWNVGTDSRDSYGQTPLFWAAAAGHEVVVRLLIERDDVEADSKDDFNRTPLSYAAQKGHEDMMRLLIERDDVEADSKDDFNRTPLSYAAQEGHEDMVRLLIERDDVKADSKNHLNRTPLSYAAEKGHEAVVRLLIERDDVEADSKDRFNRTPLSYAAQKGHEDIVRLLIERDDVKADSKNHLNRTPLLYAAEKGHEAVVRLLIERDDVEADSKDRFNRTPLSYAAQEGHEDMVRLLIERDDMKADSKNHLNRTPLSYAAEEGHEAVVRLLIERDDVEADSKDDFNRTPLSYAAQEGHGDVVRLLTSVIAA